MVGFCSQRSSKAIEAFRFCAFFALISLFLLIIAGASVRVTGAGLGCPDWPTCWGKLIPPTHISQVDFEVLNLEKFRQVAQKYGHQPNEITIDYLKSHFNAKHAWIEYLNRLMTLPLSICILGIFVISLFFLGNKLLFLSFLSLLLLVFNAWLGAQVVFSQLYPGLITFHMLLALCLFLLLVYIYFLSNPHLFAFNQRKEEKIGDKHFAFLRKILIFLFIFTFIDFLLGTGVREVTDAFSQSSQISRIEWSQKLKSHWVYPIHRSGAWMILGLFLLFYCKSKKFKIIFSFRNVSLNAILGICLVLQFVIGFIFSNFLISPFLQVIHLLISLIFISTLFLLILIFSSLKIDCEGGY